MKDNQDVLTKPYFYLAHPFDTRHEVRKIELQIEEETGIRLVNPFYDIDRPDVVNIDAGRAKRYETVNHIVLVTIDLGLIDHPLCRGVVAYMPGDCISIGTICEAWHSMENAYKQVFIISSTQTKHPWVRYMTDVSGGRTFEDWSQFKNWLLEHGI